MSNKVGLLDFIRRLYRLYRPYFGTQRNKLKRSLAAASIVILNVISAVILTFINSAMDAFLGVLAQPGVTYTAYFGSISYFLGTILLSCGVYLVSAWMASWLAESLSSALSKKFAKKWLNKKAFYGTQFMSNEATKLNLGQIMGHENPKLGRDVIEMFNDFLMTLGNFVVGIIGLYTLSVPLTFTLFSYTFTIPAFMMISTVCYAVIYNFLTNTAGQALQTELAKKRDTEAEFHHKVHHIDTRAEPIAFMKGEKYERASLLETIKKNRIVQKSLIKVRSVLLFLYVFHAEFSSFVSWILASPSIIAGKISLSEMFQISGHFQHVVNLFSFKSDYFDTITECEVRLTQMEEMQRELKKWKDFQNKEATQLIFSEGKSSSDKKIKIKNVSIKTPDDKVIIHQFNEKIKKGKTNLLEADSGKGKTTLLRAMAGLNPLATGEIKGLTGTTHFIPSEPYFPYGKTLLDAILYPRETPATEEEIKRIHALMDEMELEEKKVELNEVKDFYGKIFSDGQRKRIMLIGAIMKEPLDVLFMDEATRGIKPEMKLRVEAVLRKHLPNTTIVYTDHNPSENQFCDRKIKLV